MMIQILFILNKQLQNRIFANLTYRTNTLHEISKYKRRGIKKQSWLRLF